jgi:3-hydroxybutyrate dehydrogenase
MQKRGWGRIINIASVHGVVASLNKAAYVAAKHGLVVLTKVVALENADKGVTVNAICPGWVDTDLVAAQFQARADRDEVSLEEGKRSVIIEKQPMPKATPPSSLGDLALFLCSDAAATITGTSLPIDGGWTAQ